MLPPRAPVEKRDGRRERSVRTRKAIVASLIDLIEEGNLSPTAGQIAKRAGIAVRSIRQHFVSREVLMVAAAGEHARRMSPLAAKIDPRLSLEKRIAAFVETRSRELETSAPVRQATSRVSSAALGRATDAAWQRRREEVAEVFAKELTAASKDSELLDLLDLLSHARTWDTMRGVMQLSPDAASSLLSRSLRAAIAR
jgi:TetR/AcrR family transcriptional regulator, regulator of autoinduction and epiphytic fitness